MLMKKLVLAGACAATVLMGTGVANADPTPAPAPGPAPNSPLCAGYGGDDGQTFQYTPCGWRYGSERGWYESP